MKLIFIIICSTISVLNWITPFYFGYSELSPAYTHFTYIFVHANIIHLFLNMFVFWKLYDYLGWFELLLSFIVAFVASFYAYNLTTVGASGVVFALLGIFYTQYKFPLKYYFKNALIIGLATLIGYFSNVNIILHLLCLGGGLVMGGFNRILK